MPTLNTIVIITILLAATAAQGDGDAFSFKISPNPMFNPNVSHLLTLSKIRFSKTSDTELSPVSTAITGMFYVEISIGTPPQKLNLAIDTASSPSWAQASYCSVCFNATTPDFHAENSITFLLMPSNHSLCHGMWLQPKGSNCTYQIGYVGGQVSNGTFALDTLTTQAAVTIPGIAFGLGVENKITTFLDPRGEGNNPIVGVLGLGRDHPCSLVHQMSAITDRKFSYCLPRSVEDEGFLTFGGDEAVLRRPEIHTTPIFGRSDDLYYLRLDGISVNGERLPINPDIFLYEGHAGVVIDSAAPYTAIIDPAFQILRSAVVEYFFNEFLWIPVNQSGAQFDLCYDMATVEKRGGDAPSSFSLTFHFENADLELDQEATFDAFGDLEEYCMTIFSTKDGDVPTILGAYQQASHGFFFDVAESKLSFSAQKYC